MSDQTDGRLDSPAQPSDSGRSRWSRRRIVFTTVAPVLIVAIGVLAVRYAPFSLYATTSGRTAVTVDKMGRPVVLVHVCDVTITRTQFLTGDSRGEVYSTRVPLFAGVHELRLSDPSRRWRGRSIRELEKDARYYVNSSDQNNGYTIGVQPTASQVEALEYGQVLVGVDGAVGARVVSRSAFEGEPCSSYRDAASWTDRPAALGATET